MDSVFNIMGMVLYYHHVLFYIATKGGNVLAGVVPNVHSFWDILLDSFTVIIKGIIFTDLFFNSPGQGIQEFTKPEEVNSFYPPTLVLPVPLLQSCSLEYFQSSTMSPSLFGYFISKHRVHLLTTLPLDVRLSLASYYCRVFGILVGVSSPYHCQPVP